MRVLLGVLVVSMLSLTPNFSAAQAPAPGIQAAQSAQAVTGCLSKGSGTSYVLETSEGTRLSVTGPEELAKNVDKTVRLTGTLDEGSRTFKATAVTAIAASCSG